MHHHVGLAVKEMHIRAERRFVQRDPAEGLHFLQVQGPTHRNQFVTGLARRLQRTGTGTYHVVRAFWTRYLANLLPPLDVLHGRLIRLLTSPQSIPSMTNREKFARLGILLSKGISHFWLSVSEPTEIQEFVVA